jgi:hypothetical protein
MAFGIRKPLPPPPTGVASYPPQSEATKLADLPLHTLVSLCALLAVLHHQHTPFFLYLARTTHTHAPLHHTTPYSHPPTTHSYIVHESRSRTDAGGEQWWELRGRWWHRCRCRCHVPDAAAHLDANQRVHGRRRQPAQCVGAQQSHCCDRSVRRGQDSPHLSPDHAVGTDQGVEPRLGDGHHASFGTCTCARVAHITLAQHALTSPLHNMLSHHPCTTCAHITICTTCAHLTLAQHALTCGTTTRRSAAARGVARRSRRMTSATPAATTRATTMTTTRAPTAATGASVQRHLHEPTTMTSRWSQRRVATSLSVSRSRLATSPTVSSTGYA